VKNNDSATCAPTTFNLNDTAPSGWSVLWSTSGLSLSPGTTSSATLSVTSPTGAADGFYNVGVSVSNASASSYASSASATYVVSTPTPMTVSVSTSQPTYLPGQIVAITVSVVSGTSPDSGAGVTVSVTPPGRKGTTLTATTGSNGVASVSYKLQKRSPSGTYGVQASPASRVGGRTVQGASTTFVVQ
jgi:hypothetical protein